MLTATVRKVPKSGVFPGPYFGTFHTVSKYPNMQVKNDVVATLL